MFAAGAAHAQTAGVVTLTANRTSATGSLAPVLTWSTNPVAQSCTASGGWSGTKAASGTQTLPTINASTNYTLTCSWGNTGSANVTWTAPTTNTDGSALTNLAGFKVLYGTSSTAFSAYRSVTDVNSRSTTISSLAPGTWYFAVRAINSTQGESANSNVTSKNITGATAARTVSITITAPTPVPPPPAPPPSGTPSLKTIETIVYEVALSGNNYILGRVVGRIGLEKPCSGRFIVGNYTHYYVERTDVTFSQTSRSNVVVARCTTH
jgi:hypothetical protein